MMIMRAAFVDPAKRTDLVVSAIEIDGLEYAVLSNGIMRVIDVDSLGVLEMKRYPTVAAALAALPVAA